jgi:phosphoserine phosphatase RsbU/P
MEEQFLLTPMETSRRKFWKPWKWIGLAVYAVALLFGQWLPGIIVAAAYVYGIVTIANLGFFVFRYLKEKFFWRVRNRLISSFIFVGVIPLLIVLGAFALTIYTTFSILAGHYFINVLQEDGRLVSDINKELIEHIESSDAVQSFPTKAAMILSRHSSQFPHLASRLVHRLPNNSLEVASQYNPQGVLPDIKRHPGDRWREGASSFDYLLKDGDVILMTSFRPISRAVGYYVELTTPLDKSYEGRLRQEKSLYVSFAAYKDVNQSIPTNRANGEVENPSQESSPEYSEAGKRIQQGLKEQSAYRKSDSRGMAEREVTLSCKAYVDGKSDANVSVQFFVPRSVLFGAYTGVNDKISRFAFAAFGGLAYMFALATTLAIVIGFTISRHITRSVHDMYQGILALQNGDLQHRISVRRNDQLGLLAHSFNQMSGSIGLLLEEVVEKKRLEKELEIAREVQATLFPKHLPQPPGMSLFGGCKPARVVSGDYYDFIVEDETHLYIVVGDVSGKGISAALLMANLQAAIRSQLLSSINNSDPESVGPNLTKVMTYLNQQIYLNSPEEKYVSLFLSRYDANSRRLWYCNAGHLPSIVLNAEGIQSLGATGTVIGLFPDATYQAKSIDLASGNLLAFFTDGVTEAMNKADEEFGYNKLQTALEQSRTLSPEGVYEYVMSKVDEWQTALPPRDDITMIVAKVG